MTAVRYEYQPVTYWECPEGDARVVCHVPVPPFITALRAVDRWSKDIMPDEYYLRFQPDETLEDAEAMVEQHEATHMRSAA